MADQYPITLAEFRAWLETKRPTAIVGKRGFPSSCPIATYAKSRGEEDPRVYLEWVTVAGERRYTSPKWVNEFVYLVDEGAFLATAIQARTALRLLDRVAHASLPAEDDWERTALESEVAG